MRPSDPALLLSAEPPSRRTSPVRSGAGRTGQDTRRSTVKPRQDGRRLSWPWMTGRSMTDITAAPALVAVSDSPNWFAIGPSRADRIGNASRPEAVLAAVSKAEPQPDTGRRRSPLPPI
jgi:hypothetical protein